ncbi:TlpA family protein disulfide reductase [uncultured Enterovirga sp.]|uniref:thiol:disulfide interchange protein TlpA n=1 Tax=uncultured Enterovirga sp. TaxID=2026352 RepID=UPI0035CA6282
MIRTPLRRILAGTLALAAVALGLYGTLRYAGNRPNPACAASAAALPRLASAARGKVAAFQVASRAEPAPALGFAGPDGRRATLADFRGGTVLLNLWATWCEPCKREMPALDRLQSELGGPAFKVVAVNIDTRNLERPAAWLRDAGITALAFYSDREAKIFQDLRNAGETEGLPTTLLIGPDGCRLGRLAGWAEWASPDGLALVRAALP